MTPPPTFSSILFERPADEAQREDPSIFRDLNLDQVFAQVAADRLRRQLDPVPRLLPRLRRSARLNRTVRPRNK